MEKLIQLLPYFLDFEKEIAQSKDSAKAKAFWIKLAWEIQSCEEAIELFPDMLLCPVCLAREAEGVMSHRDPAELAV